MSAFLGLKKIAEAVVDVVMVVPDAATDLVLQEWHDPEKESRTVKRLKRVARRTGEGVKDIYQNSEDGKKSSDLSHMRDQFDD